MFTRKQYFDAIIQRKELNVCDILKAANCSRASLYRYLSGKKCPTVKVAKRIADALGVEFDDLWLSFE